MAVTFCQYNGGGGGGGGVGVNALSSLSDVGISSPTNGQALVYNSGTNTWVNGTAGSSLSGGSAGYATVWSSSSAVTYDSALYVDTTNHRVGIGTTSPTQALTIAGTNKRLQIDENSTGNSVVGFSLSGTDKAYIGAVSATNALITGGATGDFAFRSTGGNILFSTDNGSNSLLTLKASNGNVGIGITSPVAKLHVKQSAEAAAGDYALRLERSSNDAILVLGYRTNTNTFQINSTYTSTGSYAPITFHTSDAERVRIDASGYVGIGTTSPGSALDVKGTLRLSGSTSGYVGIAPAAAAGSATYTLPSADGSSGQVLSTNGSGTLSWATAGSGGGGTGVLAWVSFNSSGTVLASYNVSSVTNVTTGQWQVNFGSALSNANYAISGTCQTDQNTSYYNDANECYVTVSKGVASPLTTSSARIATLFPGTHYNPAITTVVFTGSGGVSGSNYWSGSGSNIYFNSGNVGIGTTNPGYPLTVVTASSGVGAAINGRSSDNLAGLYFYANNGATGYGTLLGSATELRFTSTPASAVETFFTNSAERMRIDSSGNVGIGTTSPAQKLSVRGGVVSVTNDDTQLAPSQLGVYGATNANQQLLMGYNTTSDYGSIQAVKQGTALEPLILNGQGGNVGIGTTSPSVPLHVHAGLAGNTGVTFEHTNGTQGISIGYTGIVKATTNGNNNLNLDGASTGNILLNANGGSGNVGIGTTSPIAKLDVEGYVLYNTPSSYGALYNGGSGSTFVGTPQTGLPASIYASGRIFAPEIDAVSDRRKKQDIVEITSKLADDFITKARPVQFHWKDVAKGKENFGFIAQEMGKAGFDNLLSFTPNAKMEETVDGDGYMSPKGFQFNLNYEGVIPLLTKAVQDLKAANDNQTREIADLHRDLKAANDNLRKQFEAYKAAHQ